MEIDENSQLHSEDEKKEENISNNDKDSIHSKNQDSTENQKIKNNKTSQEEIEVELVLKNNKNNNDPDKKSSSNNNSSEDQKKNKELTLPKIDNNSSLKPIQENSINIISNKKLISEENNTNNKEKEKEKETTINNESSKNSNFSKINNNKIIEKEEKLLKTFHKLKKALTLACVEFEDNLNRIYYPEKTEEMMNLSHVNFTKTSNFSKQNYNNELTEEQKKKEKEYFKKIKNYKSKIKTLQNELDNELMINKADELELIYKQKKSQLESLKKENTLLKNGLNKDKNKIVENQNNINKNSLMSINEKISKIKGETKIKKDYCKTLIEKIKTQNEKINELENKCDLINQNIEYYKKKKNNKNKEMSDTINNNGEETVDLNKLKKSYEEKYYKIKEKQEKLRIKVKEQNSKLKELNKHNEQLTTNIDEITSEIKDKTSQIISYENKIKIKEMQIYDKINKKKPNNNLSERKPFYISPVNYSKKNIKKVFDYQKYLKAYEDGINKYKNRLFTSADTNNKPKTLNEIEKLKTDIQQTIKKNELDDKIKKIIVDLKLNSYNKNNNNNDDEDDLQKFLKRNEQNNYRDRYNFYVTEGANLPVPIKAENINNNFYSNY